MTPESRPQSCGHVCSVIRHREKNQPTSSVGFTLAPLVVLVRCGHKTLYRHFLCGLTTVPARPHSLGLYPEKDSGDASRVVLSARYPKANIITTDTRDFTVSRRFGTERLLLIRP